MGTDQTTTTERVARRYFEAWTSRDTATAASLLADDFNFTAGGMSIEGKDVFLDQGAYPEDATTEMVAEAYQEGHRLSDVRRRPWLAQGPHRRAAPSARWTDPELNVRHRHGYFHGPYGADGLIRSMTMARRNPEVDKWFKKKKLPLEPAMQRARTIILSVDPRVTETVKWDTPTFVYKGNILSLTPSKTAVGLMFHWGAEIPGRHRRLEGEGKLVRTMRLKSDADVQAARADIEKAVSAWCSWRDKETR